MSHTRAGRIISVGGGKGGVGKSVVAANLAIACAHQGAEVILVDADLGAANQHTLFGIDRPGPTLQGLFAHSIEHLSQALVPTEVERLRLLPGSGATVGAANINHGQKQRLLRELTRLEADVVIVDVGAGVSFNTLDLFDVADLRLLVMTPQHTSIQNAYAFLKGSVYRALRRVARTAEEQALLAPDEAATDTETISRVLKRLHSKAPALATRVTTALGVFGARIIGNQIFDLKEQATLRAVSKMMRDLLSVNAPVEGALRACRRMHDSVTKRRPFLLDEGREETAQALHQIAASLLAVDVDQIRSTREATEASASPQAGAETNLESSAQVAA